MDVIDELTQNSVSLSNNGEIKLKARAVSRGIAIGEIVCLYGGKRQFYRIGLEEETQIKREIRRFRAAVRLAKKQLKKIASSNSDTQSGIFEAHSLILEDSSLTSKIEEYISIQKVNAEWAVKVISDGYIAEYKAIEDEHLRERYVDLEDISRRLLTALGGGGKKIIQLKENSVIVAKEVSPSTLIELLDNKPLAIIAENGGWTSHTFILAREMNLPAVTGIKNILRQVQNGEKVIVDGFSGEVILNPGEKTVVQYKTAASEYEKQSIQIGDTVGDVTKTLDGKVIKLRANLDLPAGYKTAKKFGASGVGLFRSEFLFNQYKGFPSELEQVEAYRSIARSVEDDGVRIRTFDLNLEQLALENEDKEKNPALGMRAIRLSFTHMSQFKIQIRALLQASAGTNISIILPMISDVSEIQRTKKIIESEKMNLRKSGIDAGDPPVGAMIEVPSAVLTIDEIASECEFLSVGTNDLVQYLLAVDRDNESVADWFRTLHPAVLRSIKLIVKAAENVDIPVIICGEMAGSPLYVPILIGLGVTELSMNVKSIPRVRKIISAIAFEEAQELVKHLENCKTADEVEEIVDEFFAAKWKHLFPKFSVNSKA